MDAYIEYIHAGLSRAYIEERLKKDGHSCIDFWQMVTSQALSEACASPSKPPTEIYQKLRKFQKVVEYTGAVHGTVANVHDLRVVCISDTHGLHRNMMHEIPQGDVLIHAGDFTDTGTRQEVIDFNDYLGELSHPYKIVIAGNHESILDKGFYNNHWPAIQQSFGHKVNYDSDEVKSILTNAVYLEDQFVIIHGLSIYGSPWQPRFGEWAFNLPRGPELASKWKKIPNAVDILITHTPPLGRGDTVGSTRVGDVDLLQQVQCRIVPKFHVFGHVHEGYGISSDGTTTYINASICTHNYKTTNAPVVFDIPKKTNAADTYATLLAMAKQRRAAIISSWSDEQRQQLDATFIQGLGCRIAGSISDQHFQKLLAKRPQGQVTQRAMKYLFQGAAQDAEKFQERKKRLINSQNIPDYSRSRPLDKLPKSLPSSDTRPSTLLRRLTVSVLVENETQPSNDQEVVHSPKANFTRTASLRPQALNRRAGVANIPIDTTEDPPLKVEATSTCVLCKYNVAGHIHPGAAPAAEESKLDENPQVERSLPQHASMWF